MSEQPPAPMKPKATTSLILTCALVALVGFVLISARNADPTILIAFGSMAVTQVIQMLRAAAADAEKKSDVDDVKQQLQTVISQTNGIMDERIKALIAAPLAKIAADVAKLQSNAPPPNPPQNP